MWTGLGCETALAAMDNAAALAAAFAGAWDIEGARSLGAVSSFLQPLEKPVPMVATADVAATAVRTLREAWEGRRVVELEGPDRITPGALAAAA